MELQIYRVRTMRGSQGSLFDSKLDPPTVLHQSILRRPTAVVNKRAVWHIGNVEPVDDTGLYFRIGRRSKQRVPVYDQSSQDFLDQEMHRAPYAHALLDWRRELVGISKEPSLAPSATIFAKRFKRLLNAASLPEAVGYTFDVSTVTNPEELLVALRNAYAITHFRYTLRRPNPWDADEAFVKPFEQLVQQTEARSGNVTVSGHSLDVTPLERITRSAAATGDEVKVRLRLEERSPPIARSLRGDTAAIPVSSLENRPERRRALEILRHALDRIRGNER